MGTTPCEQCLECDGQVDINLENAELIFSNLGGYGSRVPNWPTRYPKDAPQVLIFKNVGKYPADLSQPAKRHVKNLALVVSVASGTYQGYNLKNTRVINDLGQINFVINQPEVKLTFSLVDSDSIELPSLSVVHQVLTPPEGLTYYLGDSVTVPCFYFSLFDFDGEIKSTVVEQACVDIGGPSGLQIPKSFIPGHACTGADQMHHEFADEKCNGEPGRSLVLKSNEPGLGCDNPTRSTNLADVTKTTGECNNNRHYARTLKHPTISRLGRTATLGFKQTSSFDVTVKMICSRCGAKKIYAEGRNLMFGGRSEHTKNCPIPSYTTTTSTTSTVTETSSTTSTSTATTTTSAFRPWGPQTCLDCVTDIDFGNAQQKFMNLGGLGGYDCPDPFNPKNCGKYPINAPQVIYISNVAKFDPSQSCTGPKTHDLGLIIKVNELSPSEYRPNKLENNKIFNDLLQINFKSNQGVVALDFIFVDDATVNLPHDGDSNTAWYIGDEVELNAFYFSILDFDNEPGSTVSEHACIDYNKPSVGSGLQDLNSYIPGKTQDLTSTALEVERHSTSCMDLAMEALGLSDGKSRPGQALTIGANNVGYGCDNPTDSQNFETITANNPGKCKTNNYWKGNKKTISQREKVVDLAFTKTSSFQVTIGIACDRKPSWKCQRDGRNIIFGGTKCNARRRMEEEEDSYIHFWAKELKYYSEA